MWVGQNPRELRAIAERVAKYEAPWSSPRRPALEIFVIKKEDLPLMAYLNADGMVRPRLWQGAPHGETCVGSEGPLRTQIRRPA